VDDAHQKNKKRILHFFWGRTLFLKYLNKKQMKAKNILFWSRNSRDCRSQWPRGLRRKSTAARLLRLWFRIPPGAWMSVWCECCVLLVRGLITRPEESYRLRSVVVCDLETSWMRRPWPTGGLLRQKVNSCDWTRVICGEHINMFRKQCCFLSLKCYKCENVGDFLSLS